MITVLEQAPFGDSSGNVLAERAVQQIQEVIRVHKLALETRVGIRIPIHSCVMSLLVEHAADATDTFLIMHDGTSAYGRVKGRRFHGQLGGLAIPVMHRVSQKVHGGVMSARCLEGLWPVQCFHSGDNFVATQGGEVVWARSVRERPANVEASWKALENFMILPHMSTRALTEGSVVVVRGRVRS